MERAIARAGTLFALMSKTNPNAPHALFLLTFSKRLSFLIFVLLCPPRFVSKLVASHFLNTESAGVCVSWQGIFASNSLSSTTSQKERRERTVKASGLIRVLLVPFPARTTTRRNVFGSVLCEVGFRAHLQRFGPRGSRSVAVRSAIWSESDRVWVSVSRATMPTMRRLISITTRRRI